MAEQLSLDKAASQVMEIIHSETKDVESAASLVSDLKMMSKTNPQEFARTIYDFLDNRKIDELKASDPSFTGASAAVQGAGRSASFGLANKAANYVVAGAKTLTGDKSFSENLDAENERARLLQKAFPAASVGGEVAGFVAPGSLGTKAFKAADDVVGLAAKGLAQKTTAKFGEKAATSRISQILEQSYLAKVPPAAALGNVMYEGSVYSLDAAEQLARGEITKDEALNGIGKVAKHSFESGLKYGAGFAAAGFAGVKAYEATAKVASMGLKNAGKLMGKDLKYAIDNIDLMQMATEKTPQVVIAESVDALAPRVRAKQAEYNAVLEDAKQTLVNGLDEVNLALTGELRNTSLNLQNAVSDLRQASLGEINQKARALYNEVSGTYSKINAQYGSKIDAAISAGAPPVNLSKALGTIEAELRRGGAIDKSGRLLPGSQWAKTYPDLFSSLSELWVEMGGPARYQGGKAALNMNIRDAMLLKKKLGEISNFGAQPTNTERVLRNIYSDVRSASEASVPELREINRWYADNRSKVDNIRTRVARSEEKVSQVLQKDLADNKNFFFKEAVEMFADISPEAKQAASEAYQASDKLKTLNTFRVNPRQAFTQIRQAFIEQDPSVIKRLDDLGQRFPNLKPYIETARQQASMLKNLPSKQEVSSAMADPAFAARMSEVAPYAAKAQENAMIASRQAQELERVLPQDRLALEQKLSQNSFGQTPIEQQVVSNFSKGSPEAEGALKNAEAARTSERLRTGNIERGALEEIPVIGQTIYSLRKAATPLAARGLTMIAKASKGTRKALLGDLVENLSGSPDMKKDQLLRLVKEVGPEAAIVMYAERGGAKDIQRAAEMVAGQFEDDASGGVQ